MPVVGTFHTYSTGLVTNGLAANIIGARRLYSKLSARIAVSEAARWTAERFYGGRYTLVPNGVDLAAARPTARPGDGPLRLLFVGRAEARKGLPVLLRAFEALRHAGVDARLTVAGASPEDVEPLLLDAEGVEVAGRVSDEEKWSLLGEADLLCAPSLGGESFGMVLTEAFASATPVVASDIAGYRDVVRNRIDGVLVPAGDAVELGEELRSLALDPERRARMARAARERAERFAWPNVAREVTEVYEQALEAPAPEGAVAKVAARAGLKRSEPGSGVRPRRLPSIEPADRDARRRRVRVARRVAVGVGATAGVGLTALALNRIGIHSIGSALIGAAPTWILVGFALMCLSMLLRAEAWHAILRAALPGSARPPPRRRPRNDDRGADVGHAARAARRALARADRGPAPRPDARPLPRGARHARVADADEPAGAVRARHGDVRHRGPLQRQRGRARGGHDRPGGGPGSRAQPALAAAPRPAHALPAPPAGGGGGAPGDDPGAHRPPGLPAAEARHLGGADAAAGLGDPVGGLLHAARGARPRLTRAGMGAAAAVLFAVNVTAALPATPSNLGVFQAACVAVLSAYGVGKTDAFAYGIILQAVEICTALALGMPALVREGMTWRDLRLRALHAAPVQLGGRGDPAEAEA